MERRDNNSVASLGGQMNYGANDDEDERIRDL